MSISNLLNRVQKMADAANPRCVPFLVMDDREITERDKCPRCGGCHAIVIKEIVVMPNGEQLPVAEYRARRAAAQSSA